MEWAAPGIGIVTLELVVILRVITTPILFLKNLSRNGSGLLDILTSQKFLLI